MAAIVVNPTTLYDGPDWQAVRGVAGSVPRPYVVARRRDDGSIELWRGAPRRSDPLRARSVVRFKSHDNAMARAGALNLEARLTAQHAR